MVAGRPSFRYQALISLLAVLMINSLLTSLSGFWQLGASQTTLFIYSAVAVAVAWMGWRLPWATAGLLLLSFVGAAAGVWTGHFPAGEQYLQTLGLQLHEFVQSVQENQLDASFGTALGFFFLASSALIASLVVISESLTRGNTFFAIAIGTCVFGTQWAWFYDPAWAHFMAFAVLAFLVWILGQAARRDATWASTGRKIGYASHVATPLAWVLVLGLVSMALPSHWAPLDMGALGEKAQEAFPVLKQLRGAGVGVGTGRFSLRVTGFSPVLGSLGGPVKLDNTVALHYTVDLPLRETAYLRGATYQVYDGRTWTRGKPVEVEVPEDGTLPTYFGTDVAREYVTAKVRPAINMGFTVFSLWEPMQVKGLKNGYKADVDGYIWSNKTMGKGTSYEIFARLPKYSAEQMRKIGAMDAGEPYEPYLALPDSLPERVRTFTLGLTAKAQTPYDQAIAIEAYLRSLPYDLDAEAPPEDRDFVDFFLFDLKRGYCVYSATAMSVMLRELGIPTRMVEGFAVSPTLQYTEDAQSRRTYTVLNSQAHAWVEAYFPKYGWVTFDPTPRGDLPLIDRSTPAPQELDPSANPGGNTGSGDIAGGTNPEQDFLEGRDSTPEEAGFSPGQVTREWPWVLTALGVLVTALAVAYRRVSAQDRIAARESRGVVQEVWTKTGSLMNQFEVGPRPHQTATEYAEDLGRRWPILREPAGEVAREYTEARFAPPDHALNAQAGTVARSFWTQVHEVLFARFGWRTYFWRRLRWKHKA